MDEIPPLVRRAQALARELGFPLSTDEAAAGGPSASLPDTGRFLAVLAAGYLDDRIGEIGTGAGIGAAWLASAMPAGSTLVTVEADARLAAAAARLLGDGPRVRVLAGDAAAVLPGHAPFGLLFADGPWHDPGGPATLVDLLRVGGRIVMDDVTPLAALPPDSPLRAHDPKRDLFFADPRLVSAEVVLPGLRHALLVGTRVR